MGTFIETTDVFGMAAGREGPDEVYITESDPVRLAQNLEVLRALRMELGRIHARLAADGAALRHRLNQLDDSLHRGERRLTAARWDVEVRAPLRIDAIETPGRARRRLWTALRAYLRRARAQYRAALQRQEKPR